MKPTINLLTHLGFTKGNTLAKIDKETSSTQDDNFHDMIMDTLVDNYMIDQTDVSSTDYTVGVDDFCGSLLNALKILKKKKVYFEADGEIIFFYSDIEGMEKFVEKETKKFMSQFEK